MDIGERLATVMGRIWASRQIEQDFSALCACGGRFAGTESETRAREYLAKRMARTTGCGVLRDAVPYRGWTRGEAHILLPNGTTLPALGLVRTPATPAQGLSGVLVDLGRGSPDDNCARRRSDARRDRAGAARVHDRYRPPASPAQV
jgi:hypothetical protein